MVGRTWWPTLRKGAASGWTHLARGIREWRGFVIAAAVVLGIGAVLFWLYPDSRWNFGTTLWGVCGVGVLVWLLQARASEGVERRAWARSSARTLQPILGHIYGGAAAAAFQGINLDPRLYAALINGGYNSRKAAILRARARLAAFLEHGDEDFAYVENHHSDAASLINQAGGTVQFQWNQNALYLSRFTTLTALIHRFTRECGWVNHIATMNIPGELPPEGKVLMVGGFMRSIAEAALNLCDVCLDVEREAGLIDG